VTGDWAVILQVRITNGPTVRKDRMNNRCGEIDEKITCKEYTLD